MGAFWYYGLKLHTDLALTGLPPWPGPADGRDVELSRGEVPEHLERPVWSNIRFAVDAGNHATRV